MRQCCLKRHCSSFSADQTKKKKSSLAPPRCVSITTVTILRVHFILLGERMVLSGFIKARERPYKGGEKTKTKDKQKKQKERERKRKENREDEKNT